MFADKSSQEYVGSMKTNRYMDVASSPFSFNDFPQMLGTGEPLTSSDQMNPMGPGIGQNSCMFGSIIPMTAQNDSSCTFQQRFSSGSGEFLASPHHVGPMVDGTMQQNCMSTQFKNIDILNPHIQPLCTVPQPFSDGDYRFNYKSDLAGTQGRKGVDSHHGFFSSKSHFSYISLITMAIERSPSKMCTVSEIYEFISESFSYYRKNKRNLQNAIRYCLKLNDCFVKLDRIPDDCVGKMARIPDKLRKGKLWTLHSDSRNMLDNGCYRSRPKKFGCSGKKASRHFQEYHKSFTDTSYSTVSPDQSPRKLDGAKSLQKNDPSPMIPFPLEVPFKNSQLVLRTKPANIPQLAMDNLPPVEFYRHPNVTEQKENIIRTPIQQPRSHLSYKTDKPNMVLSNFQMQSQNYHGVMPTTTVHQSMFDTVEADNLPCLDFDMQTNENWMHEIRLDKFEDPELNSESMNDIATFIEYEL